jgi:hypothetical protein
MTTVEPTSKLIPVQTNARVRGRTPAHYFSAKPQSVENRMMLAMWSVHDEKP